MKSLFDLVKDSLRLGILLSLSTGIPAEAAINITIVQPTAGQLVDDNVFVAATVASTFELATVNASGSSRAAALVFSPNSVRGRFGSTPAWTNTISLAGLPRGSNSITVMATDVFGNTSSAQVSFNHDRKPVLVVNAPLPDAVARPTMAVDFACSDDGPVPCRIRILANGQLVATNQIAVLDLSAFDHSEVSLRFEATDSAGQMTVDERGVFVETNPRLMEAASVSGRILDTRRD